MTNPSIAIRQLDHLGLVAGMSRELQLVEIIDRVLPKHGDHKVSHGEAFVAMLLNGLGFHSATLHMFPQFFANKPIERLIAPGLQAEDLNDDVLGRCLDALYDADVSALYQVIAERVTAHLGLTSSSVHLDITSFHVDGEYSQADGDDTGLIQLVRGYSRDHRPELNQVVLELICENQAGLPVYMQALSGNTNDAKAFEKVARAHVQSLKAAMDSRHFVGDAALYTKDTIRSLHRQEQLFVTRVPMTLNLAKAQVRQSDAEHFEKIRDGYAGYWIDSDYANVPQRWLVVRSEQANKREQHTLEKRLLKESTREMKAFHKLCKQPFACQSDAQTALQDFIATLKFIRIEDAASEQVPVYAKAGRPRAGDKPNGCVFHITGQVASCLDKVELAQAQTGLFILATNDLSEQLKMDELLGIYKSQQQVERGFRFLKSPEFLTSSLYLKKPQRIEALLMVMTCSLMIYAALEHRIRSELKAQNQTIPDMKKKPTNRPTARWVFLCFLGISELTMNGSPPMLANLNEVHQTIIRVLGDHYTEIYS
jgi:transposase